MFGSFALCVSLVVKFAKQEPQADVTDNLSAITRRVRVCVGSVAIAEVARRVAVHPETVRRYLNGQPPSIEFVQSLASRFGISLSWLMAGRGPMMERDVLMHTLSTATPLQLCQALGEKMAVIDERVTRLESRLSKDVNVTKVMTDVGGSEEFYRVPSGASGVRAPLNSSLPAHTLS